MRSIKINVKNLIFEYYYTIITAFYFFTLVRTGLRTGIMTSIVILCYIIWLLPKYEYYIRHIRLIDIFVTGYMVFNLLSVLIVVFRGLPVSIFIKEFSNSLLPVCFYFGGRCLNKRVIDNFYRNFLYAIIFGFFVGICLYYIKPGFYLSYLSFYGYSNTRLSSFWGSIAMGSLSVTAVLISGKKLIESKIKNGKLLFAISLASCVLSMQRAAWITCICVLLVLHYLAFFKWKLLKARYVFIEIILFAVFVYLFRMPLVHFIENWIREHAGSNTGMFSSRTGQWISAVNNAENLLFGQGLGTTGHKAIEYGDIIVADGGLVKLFCENGVIGTVLFASIMLLAIGNGLYSLRNYYMEMGIVLAMLLQSIGSNIIAFQVLTPVFWLSVGVLANGKTRKGQKIHENYVHVPSTISCD